jgi:hypothetical protein
MSDDSRTYLGGVFLSVLTACVNSCGMGLQKRVHLDLSVLPVGMPRPYWRDRRWMAGLGCMALASCLVLVNYALLGQARASAMSSLTIVSNAVMAKYYLHESFTRIDVAATALIIAGILVAVIFGAQGGGATNDDLAALLQDLRNDVVYVSSAMIVIIVIVLIMFIRYSDRVALRPSMRPLECFARAFLAGIFSGSTGFFAKAVTYALRASVAAKSVQGSIGNVFFYIFLIGLPFSIFMQLKTLNEGLRSFDAIEIVPMYQASIVCVGVTWGWTFYQENRYLDRDHEFLFAVGCAVSVCGIAMLSLKKKSQPSGSLENDGKSATPTSQTALLGGFAASGLAVPAVLDSSKLLSREYSSLYLRLDGEMMHPDSLVLPPLG